jgi:hypothetical protein
MPTIKKTTAIKLEPGFEAALEALTHKKRASQDSWTPEADYCLLKYYDITPKSAFKELFKKKFGFGSREGFQHRIETLRGTS